MGSLGSESSGLHKLYFPAFDGSKLAVIRYDTKIDIYNTVCALPNVLGLGVAPLVKVVSKIWKRKAKTCDDIQTNRITEDTRQRNISCPSIRQRQTSSLGGAPLIRPSVSGDVVDMTSAQTDSDRLALLGPSKLSYKKLGRILAGYGSYPERYRTFIWRTLLELPGNEAAFTSLVSRGTHSSWSNIGDKFQIKSPRLTRILEKILSALAHWSEIFAELEYLPMLIFPFVKIFQNNHLICFEVCATFLKCFALHWFEFFPNPPIGVMSVIENVIAENDKNTYHHLVHMKVTSQTYAWPILQTVFSEVLTKDEALVFFDHVFYNRNSLFLLCAVAAYVIICKEPILRITEFDDFEYFFRHRNAISVGLLLKKTEFLYQKTIQNHENLRFSRHYMRPFEPLTVGQYPIFNQYPEFVVDYRKKETERIRKEQQSQMNSLKETETDRVLGEISKIRGQAESWLSQQRAVDAAVTERRTFLQRQNKIKSGQNPGINKPESIYPSGTNSMPVRRHELGSTTRPQIDISIHHQDQGYELDSADLTWETADSILSKRETSRAAEHKVIDTISKLRRGVLENNR